MCSRSKWTPYIYIATWCAILRFYWYGKLPPLRPSVEILLTIMTTFSHCVYPVSVVCLFRCLKRHVNMLYLFSNKPPLITLKVPLIRCALVVRLQIAGVLRKSRGGGRPRHCRGALCNPVSYSLVPQLCAQVNRFHFCNQCNCWILNQSACDIWMYIYNRKYQLHVLRVNLVSPLTPQEFNPYFEQENHTRIVHNKGDSEQIYNSINYVDTKSGYQCWGMMDP